MKTSYLFTFLFSFICSTFCQVCTSFTGGVLSDSVALNVFNEGCTEIVGNVQIESTASFAIQRLSNIERITGDFEMKFNGQIRNLHGLGSLIEVTGNFELGWNTKLSIADGYSFSGPGLVLQTIGGHFRFHWNYACTSLSGFNSLRTVGGILYFTTNDILPAIDSFNSLTSVGSYIYIIQNPSLATIGGFALLRSTAGIWIDNNPVLVDLDAFQLVSSAPGAMAFTNHPNFDCSSPCNQNILYDLSQLSTNPNIQCSPLAPNINCAVGAKISPMDPGFLVQIESKDAGMKVKTDLFEEPHHSGSSSLGLVLVFCTVLILNLF